MRAGSEGAFDAALPPGAISRDPAECTLLSADIAGPAPVPAALVLRPRTPAQVQRLVRVARAEGIALHPRGGGWSYTGGFTPARAGAALVDLRGLQGIAIDRAAETVTAAAGVTWSDLDAALAETGLRAASFGPLSGIGATVGGLAAQDGGFFGAAGHGAMGDGAVRGTELVDGTAEPVTLGYDDRTDAEAAPQPLVGDCGAFGIRTAVTLAIVARPAASAFASYAFADAGSALAALQSLVGLRGLGEAFVFDPGSHALLARSGFSVRDSAGVGRDLLRSGGGVRERVAGLVRTARAGSGFMAELAYSLHVSLDGDPAMLAETCETARRHAEAMGGTQLPDVIPRVTRARPFRPIKALVGPDGEAWLPAHGVFAPDRAAAGVAAVRAALAAAADSTRRHGISCTLLIALLGRRILVEPQLFWPDALGPAQRAMARPEQVARFGARPGEPAARAAAHAVRAALIAALDGEGATHFQIGRRYAAHPGVPSQVRATWAALKRRFDPDGIMNPGALGL